MKSPSLPNDPSQTAVETPEEGSVIHRIHARCAQQGFLRGQMKLPYAMYFDVPVDAASSYSISVRKVSGSPQSIIVIDINLVGPMGLETESFLVYCTNEQITNYNYTGHEPVEKDNRLQYVLHHAVGLFQE